MSQVVAGSPKGDSLIKRVYGPLFTSKLWLQTLHLLIDLPVGLAFFFIASFIRSVSGGLDAFSGGLLIAIFGIPFIAGVVL